MSKRILSILIVISLIIGWQLLRPGYYSMHDDLQVMRIHEMDRCFKDGQIPCRWAPDMGQNYGQPLFNFYSALPYYLGEVIHLSGLSIVDTVKVLFLLSIFLSGLFLYFLSKEFFKSEAIAMLSAVAYMTAPYHAVDIFVRGALSESYGLAFIPLVLYAIIRINRRPNTPSSIILALSVAALLTTHNISTLISAPIFVVFGVYFFWVGRDHFKQLIFLVPAVIFGIGLSAFFLFPVLLDQRHIQTQFLTTDYFDFRAHFATIRQLFTNLSWNYGPSRFNSFQYPETMSFFVGILSILSFVITPVTLYLSRNIKDRFRVITVLFIFGLISLFMVHPRSFFIWESLPLLRFTQFPWRFLGLVSLFSSLLIGFALESLPINSGPKVKLISFLIAFAISSNLIYFRFEKYFPNMTDNTKLAGIEYDNQIKGALLDYLPKTVKKIPESKAPDQPIVLIGKVSTNYFDKRSGYFSSEFDIYTDKAIIQFPVMDFPGWTIYQNRQPSPVSFSNDNDYGLITLNLSKGHQLIQGFFGDTPLRAISNMISFGSGIILASWLILSKQKNES